MFYDLRYAFRMLVKTPGFTVVAVISLALGIGLCTTIFNVVNPILFRPLPFPGAGDLIYVNATGSGFSRLSLSYADYLDWRAQNRVFEELGAWNGSFPTLGTGDGQSELQRVSGARVSASLFPTLGIQPILGRQFRTEEEVPGAPGVVMISHTLWQNRFSGDRGVVGQSIELDGEPRIIVGVMPERFGFPANSEVWTPLIVASPESKRGSHSYAAVGRLKVGVTLQQAYQDLVRVAEGLSRQFPGTNADVRPVLVPLREEFLGSNASMSWIVLGAVGFVLAVACANVANLFLARVLGREKEFAIRAAMGSSRWRAVRLVFAECMIVAAAGGVGGFLLSRWGVDVVLRLVMELPPSYVSFEPDYRVLAFAAGSSLLTCLIFGLGPAWHVSGANAQEGLKDTSRGSGQSLRRGRLRNVLVVSEVALAVLLLSGAGLMVRTIINLHRTPPGFNPGRLAVLDFTLPAGTYNNDNKRRDVVHALIGRVAAMPGIDACSAVSSVPMSGHNDNYSFFVEAEPLQSPGREPSANTRIITPGYFSTMQIPVIRGRDFTAEDGPSATQVVIVEQSFAQRYLKGDAGAIGRRIRFGSGGWMEVVGIVGDVKHEGLDSSIFPGIYLPHAQRPTNSMSLVVRTTGDDPLRSVSSIRAQVKELDPRLWFDVTSMSQRVQRSYWIRRLLGQLFGAFSVFGMILAGVGIAGVVGYSVTQRTHEIGVRMAIGADKADILRLVIWQGMIPVVLGLSLGLLGSLGLTQLLSNQLFGVGAFDPLTLAISAGMFSVVGILACLVPARRASRVDPMVALRSE